MKAAVIAVKIGGFETIPKDLIKELEDLEIKGKIEIIQSTASLESAGILRRVLET